MITPDMQVNNETLHQWLNSGDPRLIAWAADFARRTHDTQIVSEMPSLLEQSSMATRSSWNVSRSQHQRALTAVLDTLIEEKVQVPIPAVEEIAEDFPAQAAILMSRLPLAESRVTLSQWVAYDSAGSGSAHLRARVAAMLLATDPDPNFVAGILRDSEEYLNIVLVRSGGLGGGSGGGSCEDSGSWSPPPNWPLVHAYGLAENDNNGSSTEIASLDGDRITSQRFQDTEGRGSCYRVEPLDPRTRHRLIAHWLGVQDDAMPWHAQEDASIVWVNLADYKKQLGEVVELHREQLQATVQTLCERGLLTRADADATMPKLSISIQCRMTPCPLRSKQQQR